MIDTIGNSEQFIEKINEVLKNKTDAVINIINDKLTLSVFALLEENLQNVKQINFIIRDVKFIPDKNEISHEFDISPNDVLYSSYDIVEKNKLEHFSKAKSMHDFIKKNVNVKKVNSNVDVKGNVLIIDDDFLISGSSSLELNSNKRRRNHSFSFDTFITSNNDKNQIMTIKNDFNQIWCREDISTDYKEELLTSLSYIYKDHSPEFLYYFTLNELFGYKLDLGIERFERDSEKFKKTQIWNTLFDFQKDCVVSAIQKLQKYGGCIIADSVGLGKTFEALAVIKYFEIKMDNVLVITPAKLYDNWNSFKGDYTDSFLKEIFNYKIMFHTDLSRYEGMSKSGQDLSRFDWGNYDLVVIDESHNFRNRKDRYDDNDQLIMTRYARLLQDVIKQGKNNTKVLLLSATPVNNSLVDLKNQVSIITGDRDFHFEEEGIASVDNLLRRTSAVINLWEEEPYHQKDALLDSLSSEFYKLLELMTISRSRKHITGYYGNNGVGQFPIKNSPITYNPDIDEKARLLKFEDTNELLEELLLRVHTPILYVKREYRKIYIEKYNLIGKRGGNMDFDRQAEGMVVLQRFNLFKRLESSVYSFSETIRRLMEKIDRTIEKLEKGSNEAIFEEFFDEDSEDDSNTLEGKYEIEVKHLRINDFLVDLKTDKYILEKIYRETSIVLENDRDEKLRVLKEIIYEKVTTTPYNEGNKKILIFTAFSDTATYIYSKIANELKELNLNTACVSGKGVKSTNSNVYNKFNSILCAFSPQSKMKREIPASHQVDILIGTDCISEGQNLQDCDTVINFDIQWNPVSLIQRFGRIDRIGSTNTNIQMINFFPNVELNEYLRLEQRVKNKMTTLNLVSTGDEDTLSPEMNDFYFRKRQLERLKDEVIDIDDANDNISLSDLNMNEYLYELSSYIANNKSVAAMPRGIFSVTEGENHGVLLCFKHRDKDDKPKSDSSIYPYYLIYIDNDGQVLYGNSQAREVLKVFRKLCYEKKEPVKELFDKFANRTNDTTDMRFYSSLLSKAVKSIKGAEEEKAISLSFDFTGFKNSCEDDTVDDFELISFLVVE